MSHGLWASVLALTGVLITALPGQACPLCSEPATLSQSYQVADLVIPVDRSPITLCVGDRLGYESAARAQHTTASVELQDDLMARIMRTIQPGSWVGHGGTGTITYNPANMTLTVVNSPVVQRKIASLLRAIRRKQDLAVALEFRLVRVSEATVERIRQEYDIGTGAVLEHDAFVRLMELAQEDRNCTVMQAPRVTVCDAQQVNLRIAEGSFMVDLNVTPHANVDHQQTHLSVRVQGNGEANTEHLNASLAEGSALAFPGGPVTELVRTENGPPVLSRIPYVNRLFKQVGYGSETMQTLILVSSRVVVPDDSEPTACPPPIRSCPKRSGR